MKITFYIGEKSFDYNPEEDLKNGVTLPFVLEDTEGKEEAIPAPAEEPAQQMSDKFF